MRLVKQSIARIIFCGTNVTSRLCETASRGMIYEAQIAESSYVRALSLRKAEKPDMAEMHVASSAQAGRGLCPPWDGVIWQREARGRRAQTCQSLG